MLDPIPIRYIVSGNSFLAVPAAMYKKSPPIPQTRRFTANELVCLAV